MDHVVLGDGIGDQPVNDPYVVTFSWMCSSELVSPLPVLLVCRIWYIDRKATKLRGHQQSQLKHILHILVDAGAIYSLSLLVALICFVSRSNGQFVVLDLVSSSFPSDSEESH